MEHACRNALIKLILMEQIAKIVQHHVLLAQTETDAHLVLMDQYYKEITVRKNVDMEIMQIQIRFVKNAMMLAQTVQDHKLVNVVIASKDIY